MTRPRPSADAPVDPGGLAALDPHQPPWPGELREVGGSWVHVRTSPGPEGVTPAVFVHGLGGSASNWTDLAGLLSNRMPGVALDLPGFGRSDPPGDGLYSVELSADLVVDLLTETGPAHLFGNSMGGAVCLVVAARRPDLVRTLTLISPAVPDLRPDPRRLSDPRLPLAFVPGLGRRVREQLRATPPQQRAQQLVRLCFADPSRVPQHKIDQAAAEAELRAGQGWAAQALGRSFGALLQSWLVLPGRSLWAEAGRVTAPTLVIWGAQDRLVNVDRAPRLLSRLARGRLLVLNQVGHVAQMERPVPVARAVVDLLAAVERGEW